MSLPGCAVFARSPSFYPSPNSSIRNLKGLHNSSPGLSFFGFPITRSLGCSPRHRGALLGFRSLAMSALTGFSITNFWQFRRFWQSLLNPLPPFVDFCCKQRCLDKSIQGWPLRHAWVALGPRLGHPRATQSQTQSQSGRGSQVLSELLAKS